MIYLHLNQDIKPAYDMIRLNLEKQYILYQSLFILQIQPFWGVSVCPR